MLVPVMLVMLAYGRVCCVCGVKLRAESVLLPFLRRKVRARRLEFCTCSSAGP